MTLLCLLLANKCTIQGHLYITVWGSQWDACTCSYWKMKNIPGITFIFFSMLCPMQIKCPWAFQANFTKILKFVNICNVENADIFMLSPNYVP